MANEVFAARRRAVLAGGGALLATGLFGAPAIAHQTTSRPVSLLFDKTGNFDLSDPGELLLARAKALTCLAGERTHICAVSRHMLAEPGKPTVQILTELDLMTVWLTPSVDGARNKAVINALFTRIAVDMFSFEPISSYYNPVLGREVEVKHTQFGGKGLGLDPSDPVPNVVLQQDEPHYTMGDDLAFVMFDPRLGEGAFQPHVDSAIFKVDRDALMDPATSSVPSDYSFTAFLKASVFKWSNIAEDNDTRVLSLKVGRKVVGGVAALPLEFRNTFATLYPERV